MTTDRELMQQALDVLKIFIGGGNSDWARKIEALRDRLAQPEEPDWSAAGFSKPPTHSEAWWKHEVSNAYANGYEKGRASVKQPEQEPVAWIYSHKGQKSVSMNYVAGVRAIPLYTAPSQREWQGLTDEELHLQAAAYASRRKNAYLEGMKQGEVDHMSEEALNGKWLAHYEGYREGYWVATGDDRYTTDPAKEHKRGKNT